MLDDDDAIDDDDAPLDAFDVTEEDPLELGGGAWRPGRTTNTSWTGRDRRRRQLDDDPEVSETNQRPGANVRRTVLTGEERARARGNAARAPAAAARVRDDDGHQS